MPASVYYPTPVYFGRTFSDYPKSTTVNGVSGWLTLPRQWVARAFVGADGKATNQIQASPTGDFTIHPVYICVLDDSGQQYAFQDLLLEKILGISGNPTSCGVNGSTQT